MNKYEPDNLSKNNPDITTISVICLILSKYPLILGYYLARI